jgi:hypothetical protein
MYSRRDQEDCNLCSRHRPSGQTPPQKKKKKKEKERKKGILSHATMWMDPEDIM